MTPRNCQLCGWRDFAVIDEGERVCGVCLTPPLAPAVDYEPSFSGHRRGIRLAAILEALDRIGEGTLGEIVDACSGAPHERNSYSAVISRFVKSGHIGARGSGNLRSYRLLERPVRRVSTGGPLADQVRTFAAQRGPFTVSEVTGALGLRVTSVHRALEKLRDLGEVQMVTAPTWIKGRRGATPAVYARCAA